MTCIVGLVAKGEAYIGADSAGVDSNTRHTSVLKGNPKIFKRKGYVISGAGNLRQFSVLKGAFNPPKPPEKGDLLDFLNTEFVKVLRETLAAHNAKPGEYDGNMIFGVQGRVFNLGADFFIYEPSCGYVAGGSGRLQALGALHVTRRMTVAPRRRVKLALEAASDLCNEVLPPHVIFKVS